MIGGWISVDEKAQKVKDLFVGINGKARRVLKGYVGINGVAVKVYPRGILIPTVSGIYTYNGSVQAVQFIGYDDEFMTLSGDLSATNAGTYTVTASLKYSYLEWEDGTKTDKVISWVINKKIVNAPHDKNWYVPLKYTGATLRPDWTDYDDSIMYCNTDPEEVRSALYDDGMSSTIKSVYTYMYFHIYPTAFNNYQFDGSDGGPKTKCVHWRTNISRLYVNVETLNVSVGSERTYTIWFENSWRAYDAERVSVDDADVTRESSDTSIFTIVESSANSVKIRGIRQGSAVIMTSVRAKEDCYEAPGWQGLPEGRVANILVQVQ